MKIEDYYHQKFFRSVYRDMQERIEQYGEIQQTENPELRRHREEQFLEEQRITIRRFIGIEKYARRELKRGLRLQQRDIEGFWRRRQFGRVKNNCMDRFDNLIAFAKKVGEILDKEHFDEEASRTLIFEIEDELKTIIHLSDDYEIKRYSQGILQYARRKKGTIALTILFLAASAIAASFWTNYHIMPQDTQTPYVRFVGDDMRQYDWAQGTHFSFGFHTMLDRVVRHQSNLEGLQYRGYEDQRHGNQDANILDIYGGGSKLLPNFMRRMLGDNVKIEVQALNKGDVVIIIANPNKVIDIYFSQDKIHHINKNIPNFSEKELVEMYHAIRGGIEHRVNTN